MSTVFPASSTSSEQDRRGLLAEEEDEQLRINGIKQPPRGRSASGAGGAGAGAGAGGSMGRWRIQMPRMPLRLSARRLFGSGLIALVVFLWTASSFLASAILADNTYNKPFLMCYLNTAFFILPLIPILLAKAWQEPEELREWKHDTISWVLRRRQRFAHSSTSPQRDLDADDDLLSTSQTLLLPQHASSSKASSSLSLSSTFRLSFPFAILWYLANYSISACLSLTTVASSTIITSTAGIFTLIFGYFTHIEPFTIPKLLGSLASLAGIALISSVDLSSGGSADDEHRGDFPEKTPGEVALGDALALLAAALYGWYAVYMKQKLPDSSVVSMPIFFGCVGLWNVVLWWPAFFLLHWTGIEPFALPSADPETASRVWMILVLNGVASMVADLAWAYAVVLTSPLVVTVGLSLTIPLSLVGQMVLNRQSAGAVYWVGAALVVAAFLFVNREEGREASQKQRRIDEGSRGILGE